MSRQEGPLKCKKGFTLIELVISVAILSLVMSSLFFLFSSFIKELEHIDHRLFALQNARQGLMWLTSNISQAKEVHIISGNKLKVTLFNGDTISFYLKDGVLYREKNTGVNPIAELNHLNYVMPQGHNYVEIELGSGSNDWIYTIRIKVTPVGNIKN